MYQSLLLQYQIQNKTFQDAELISEQDQVLFTNMINDIYAREIQSYLDSALQFNVAWSPPTTDDVTLSQNATEE
jgi:hypothetical protein